MAPEATKTAPAAGSEPLGAEFTQMVIDSMGPKTSPRLREVMAGLTRHMHDFAREVRLTTDEWLLGMEMINRAGQMSDEKRNEGQLLCDVIGFETLLDDITYGAAMEPGSGLTPSAILGPFWRETVARENGSNISSDTPPDGQPVFMHGRVTDVRTGKPLAGATVDVWQASTNGLYEQQDPNQKDHNLRGIFTTDADGRYFFYCLRPTPYPIPRDGPAGELLDLIDRHVYRPAHIHLLVQAKGYGRLVTQIFDQESEYMDNDTVFAVKSGLSVRFVPREGDPQAKLELQYDISLAESS